MRRAEAGITLIELLLAVTLFAAISVSMAMVLNVSFTSMNRIDAKVDFNRRVVSSQKALDQILQGLIPILAPCNGRLLGMVGMETGVRFVTSYSLTEGSRGRPQIAELFPDPSPNGGVRLLLNERPFLGKASLAEACSLPFVTSPTSFVLADRLAFCRFGYRRIEPSTSAEVWMGSWPYPEWPSAMRILMAPLEPKPNQILPSSVFVPLLVRDRKYGDTTF